MVEIPTIEVPTLETPAIKVLALKVRVHKSVFVSPLSQPIFFHRHNEGTILRELFRKLKRRELDIMKTPDITFINEDGIDAVGLSKEFFAMVSAALSNGCGGYTLFERSPDHLLPVISEEFHQTDYFVYVGSSWWCWCCGVVESFGSVHSHC